MANDLNQCNFIGRLGRDLEARTFPSGDMVANGTLAVGSKWKDRATGETKENTEWVRLVFNGKQAEIATQYTRKGSQLYVSGEMRTRKWTDQSGVEKYATEIRVNNFQLLGGKQDGDQQDQAPRSAAPRQAPAPRPAPAPRQAPAPAASSGFDDMADDLPFRDALSFRGAHLIF